MAQITIEVPDALIAQLAAVQDRLPEVLARGLADPSPLLQETYRSVLKFLTGTPSAQEILAFKLAPEIQDRISVLLEKNRQGQLHASEEADLDEYVEVNDAMRQLKIRALEALKTTP